MPKDGHVYFFPAVTFPTADKKPINTEFDDRPVANLFGWTKHSTFVSKVRIPDTAAFAVVHTLQDKIGEKYVGNVVKAVGMGTIVNGVVMSFPGADRPLVARYTSSGKVIVSLEN